MELIVFRDERFIKDGPIYLHMTCSTIEEVYAFVNHALRDLRYF